MYSDFLSSDFLSLGYNPGHHSTFTYHLLRFLFPVTKSQTLHFWPWQLWRLLVRNFAECLLIGICLMFFSWLEWECEHFWRKITEVKCHSHHFISRVHEIKMTSFLMSEIILVRFINWKSTLCTLFIICSWTLVHAPRGHTLWATHIWRMKSYVLPSKGLTIHISCVELFCMGDLSTPYIYVFIYEVREKVISVLDCEF